MQTRGSRAWASQGPLGLGQLSTWWQRVAGASVMPAEDSLDRKKAPFSLKVEGGAPEDQLVWWKRRK